MLPPQRRRPVLAFSERVIAEAEAAGATSIVVNDKETGHAYRVTMAALRVNGKQFDMSYERRIALHISQWEEVEAEDQLPLWS